MCWHLISNLICKTLLDIEIEKQKYGLKHGIITRPSEAEIVVMAEENFWYQIEQKGLCNHVMKHERVQTALRVFTYYCIDIYNKQHSRDNINTINNFMRNIWL